MKQLELALNFEKKNIIPDWVLKGNYKISLDKYYTHMAIAKYCYESLLSIAKLYNINTENYTFLEPSAGNGSFFDLLPQQRRIGIDIEPESKEIIRQDFFDWRPKNKIKYITIGNPPFGLRSWLALSFINKAAEFSDLVGFILPMYFDSEGKGSAKYRVKGLNLLHSEELPADIFHNGKPVKINTVWQVWGKMESKVPKRKQWNNQAELFTVCTNPKRKCGLDKMAQYNFFIPSTFYDKVEICKKFDNVSYGSGIGVITKNLKIEPYLKKVDWQKYSIRATNHCRHIGIGHIKNAIIDGGF